MANEFKIKKGLIVTGASGGTVVDIQGSQGQLFSVTDDLSGSIFAVSDISGVPILDVNSNGTIQFSDLGAGTLVTDASGNITASSGGGAGGPYLPLAGGTMTLASSPLILPGEESNQFKIAFTGASASSGLSTVDQSGAGLYIGANSRVNNSGVVVFHDTLLPSSGIYFDGWSGDDMEFYTGSSGNPTKRLTLSAGGDAIFTGNVGIGTTSPDAKLDIEGDFEAGYALKFTNTKGTGTVSGFRSHGVNGEDLSLYNGANRIQRWDENGNSIFDGNVGIGTSSPETKLTIENASGGAASSTYATTASNANLHLSAVGVPFYNHLFMGIGSATYAWIQAQHGNSIGQNLALNPIGGNVGIGTTSPGAKLEVNSDGFPQVRIHDEATGGEAGIRFKSFTATANDLHGDIFVEHSSGNETGRMGFRVPYTNERLTILSTGNVGIGTTSPSTDLQVIGTVRADVFGVQDDSTNPSGNTSTRVTSPAGATYDDQNNSASTGVLSVILPTVAASTMLSFTIRVFDYANNESFDVNVAGYWYGSGLWTNTSVRIESQGNVERNFNVRFGKNNTTNKGWVGVGETTTNWSYVKFAVLNFQAAHVNDDLERWNDLWDTAVLTSLTDYTTLVTKNNNQVNNWARNGENLYYGSGSGNVGIGTTSPGVKMDVEVDSASAGDLLRLTNSNTGGGSKRSAMIYRLTDSVGTRKDAGYIRVQGTNNNITAGASMEFWTRKGNSNPTESMRISTNGNVGIGTTSPDALLEISGNAGADPGPITNPTTFRITDAGNAATGAGDTVNPWGKIEFYSEDVSSTGPSVQAQIASVYNTIYSNSSDLQFYTRASPAVPLSTRMTIDGVGNVGIGTTNPYGHLHLEGGQQDIVLTNTAADGVANLTISRIIGQARGYSNNGAAMQSIDFVTNTTTWYKGDIVFKTNNTDGTDTSVAATEKMRIASNGNVGIGFTSPDSTPLSSTKLSVNGNTYVAGTLGVGNTSPPVQFVVNNGVVRTNTAKTYSTFIHTNDSDDYRVGLATAVKGGATANDRYVSLEGASYRLSTDTFTNEFDLVLNPIAGNVGIGTSTPNAKLDIQGTQGQLFSVTDNLSGSIFAVADISGVPIFDVNSSGVSYFDGKVGIGTASPLNKTHIVGPTLATGTETTYGLAISDVGDQTKTLILGYDLVNDVGIIQAIDQQTAWKNLAFGISGNSKVGIGTTSPSAKLEISEAAGGTGLNIINGGETAFRFSTKVEDTNVNTVVFRQGIYHNNTENATIAFYRGGSSVGGFMTFQTQNGNERMRIKNNGNVGINTTNPNQKLHVNGGTQLGDINATVNFGTVALKVVEGTVSTGPTLGSGTVGAQAVLYSNGLFGMYTGVSNNGDTWMQSQRNDTGTSTYDILLNPLGGNVGIGTTGPLVKLHVNQGNTSGTIIKASGISAQIEIQTSTAGDAHLYMRPNSTGNNAAIFKMTAGTNYNWRWQDDSTTPVVFMQLSQSNSSLSVKGDVIAYGSPSDERYKENIKPIESALDKVTKLQGVTFDWKESDNLLDIKEDIGFIAQDVQKVVPELVRENEDGKLSLRYQGITPILLEAIKELKEEIDLLKSKPCNCNKCNCNI